MIIKTTDPGNFSPNRTEGLCMATNCEDCWYYDYDEEMDEYYCAVDMDEDEYYHWLTRPENDCPYFRDGNEYTIARRQ